MHLGLKWTILINDRKSCGKRTCSSRAPASRACSSMPSQGQLQLRCRHVVSSRKSRKTPSSKKTHQGPCLGLGMSTSTFQQVSFEGLLGPNRFQLLGPPCRGTGWTVQGAKRGGLRARNSALLGPVDARKGRAEPETLWSEVQACSECSPFFGCLCFVCLRLKREKK